ncbi:hypothetical protein CC85DRAFT_120719 [Cutaneotrichosporon oleaginosum]|uniref:Uncharacterized protein n=1 Tax=Cutaneotrichosporon oleaginosum TaxID=879819 RepID=A0A0J0XK01_9TREE|nr:uncharacterized protein CC85DRAFT_120719 [Cutaneotrichosporon oleaginosum]KLT41408.1 hypothetical protein CC85DRAFT_120719 [Cutaneotrichosporon oleaginosum]TXT12171.1 hypothetical protein COLE_02581 [Cutaneotrichosporon oleaginosum]
MFAPQPITLHTSSHRRTPAFSGRPSGVARISRIASPPIPLSLVYMSVRAALVRGSVDSEVGHVFIGLSVALHSVCTVCMCLGGVYRVAWDERHSHGVSATIMGERHSQSLDEALRGDFASNNGLHSVLMGWWRVGRLRSGAVGTKGVGMWLRCRWARWEWER